MMPRECAASSPSRYLAADHHRAVAAEQLVALFLVVGERLPRDTLHHQVGASVLELAVVVERDHVPADHRGGGAHLPLEAKARLLARREQLGHHLDRHLAVCLALVHGGPDLGHRATPERPLEQVSLGELHPDLEVDDPWLHEDPRTRRSLGADVLVPLQRPERARLGGGALDQAHWIAIEDHLGRVGLLVGREDVATQLAAHPAGLEHRDHGRLVEREDRPPQRLVIAPGDEDHVGLLDRVLVRGELADPIGALAGELEASRPARATPRGGAGRRSPPGRSPGRDPSLVAARATFEARPRRVGVTSSGSRPSVGPVSWSTRVHLRPTACAHPLAVAEEGVEVVTRADRAGLSAGALDRELAGVARGPEAHRP